MKALPEVLMGQWKRELFPRRPIKRVILFGSRAREDAGERADIDLAIEAPQATRKEWLDICSFLREDSQTLLSIDVVRLEEAPSELREKILKEGIVLYERR